MNSLNQLLTFKFVFKYQIQFFTRYTNSLLWCVKSIPVKSTMGQILSRPRRRQSALYHSEEHLNIKEIVNILITDGVLISNWQKLFDGLNLKAEEYKHLERQVNNSTIKGYELFSTILTQWLSAEGSNATTDVLQRVLEENGFREVAGIYGFEKNNSLYMIYKKND